MSTFYNGVNLVTPKNQTKTNEENREAKDKKKRPATTSVLAVVDAYPDALQRSTTNNPVATRTVFTTQIWDLYWNSPSIAPDGRRKSAQCMRQGRKEECRGPLRRPEISSEHRVSTAKRNSTAARDGSKTAQSSVAV